MGELISRGYGEEVVRAEREGEDAVCAERGGGERTGRMCNS